MKEEFSMFTANSGFMKAVNCLETIALTTEERSRGKQLLQKQIKVFYYSTTYRYI